LLSSLYHSGGNPVAFTSAVIRETLEDQSFDRHLDWIRVQYGAMARTLTDRLLQCQQEIRMLSQWTPGAEWAPFEFVPVRGGYFCWLTFQDWFNRARMDSLHQELNRRQLSYFRGESSSVAGQDNWRSIRFCFAWSSPAELRQGVDRLHQAILAVLDSTENK
jgi:DNA-binding transcriptional MocR family regulator